MTVRLPRVDSQTSKGICPSPTSCHEARREWYDMVRRDAEREYELGDVDEATLNGFLAKLEEEEPAS